MRLKFQHEHTDSRNGINSKVEAHAWLERSNVLTIASMLASMNVFQFSQVLFTINRKKCGACCFVNKIVK